MEDVPRASVTTGVEDVPRASAIPQVGRGGPSKMFFLDIMFLIVVNHSSLHFSVEES